MNKLLQKIVFGLLVFLIFGCTQKIVPIKSTDVRVKEGYAVISKKFYDIAIQAQSWNDAPHNLENYFTVFFIIVRNKTKETMHLKKNSFVLLDGQNEQYSLFSSDDVITIMYGDDQFYNVNYFNYLLELDSENKDELKEELEERMEGMRNIKLKAFQFRNIRPQAQESGYIFFEKVRFKKNSFFKIYYNNDVAEFAITD